MKHNVWFYSGGNDLKPENFSLEETQPPVTDCFILTFKQMQDKTCAIFYTLLYNVFLKVLTAPDCEICLQGFVPVQPQEQDLEFVKWSESYGLTQFLPKVLGSVLCAAQHISYHSQMEQSYTVYQEHLKDSWGYEMSEGHLVQL